MSDNDKKPELRIVEMEDKEKKQIENIFILAGWQSLPDFPLGYLFVAGGGGEAKGGRLRSRFRMCKNPQNGARLVAMMLMMRATG